MIYLKCFTLSARKNCSNYCYDLSLTYSLLKILATIISGNCGLTSSGKDFWIIHYYNDSHNQGSIAKQIAQTLETWLLDFLINVFIVWVMKSNQQFAT